MNFKNYYLNQAGGGLPYFQGSPYQRGYGLGGVFRRIFKWIMPIIKEHGYPIIKTLGKEVIKGVSNLANDSLDGKEFDESAKLRLQETINSLKQTTGKGIKRKYKQNSAKKKLIKGEGFISKIKPKRKSHIKGKKIQRKLLDIFGKK